MNFDDLLRLEQQATKGPWRGDSAFYGALARAIPRHQLTRADWELVCASRNVLRELVEVAKAADEMLYQTTEKSDVLHSWERSLKDALARLAARLEEMG